MQMSIFCNRRAFFCLMMIIRVVLYKPKTVEKVHFSESVKQIFFDMWPASLARFEESVERWQ